MGKGQLYLESEAHKNYLSKLITDQWTEEEWLRLRQQGEHRMDARKQTRKGLGTNNVSVTKVGQMDGISTVEPKNFTVIASVETEPRFRLWL